MRRKVSTNHSAVFDNLYVSVVVCDLPVYLITVAVPCNDYHVSTSRRENHGGYGLLRRYATNDRRCSMVYLLD